MKKLLHERLAEWIEEDPMPDYILLRTKERRVFYEELLKAIKQDYIPKNKEVPMEKLLHERLRECKRKTSYLDLSNGPGILISKQTAKELADEIERYYIPRPRFEDGEPVQFGDAIDGCDGKVEAMLLFDDGSGTVYGENDECLLDDHCGVDIEGGLRRPSTKVLDADGVEIKIGDTVYFRKDPTPRIVVEARNMYVRTTDGHQYPHPEYLTHKEPDSLKKIRDDMLKNHEDWVSDPNIWVDFADRVDAFIEKANKCTSTKSTF